VTLPANTASVVAYYGDTVAQSPTLTVGATGLTSGTQSETINAAAPAKFVFTSTAVSGTASSNAVLGPITVQEQDTFGNATVSAETVNLTSTDPATDSYALTSGGAQITSVSISSGSSSASFFYDDTQAGTPTVTASGSLTSATQIETISAGPASTIAISSGSGQTTSPSAAFASPLVALVTDSYGNPVSGASVTFTGPSSGASETFATGGNCTSNPHVYACTATTAATGLATSTVFTANATAGGPYNIAASASGTNTVNFSETNANLLVSSISSTNASGNTVGQAGVGDTFSVTFNMPLNPSTINTTAGASTLTQVGSGSSTTITISNLTSSSGFSVGSNYEKSGNTSTAAGTLSLSNGNMTVTFTITGSPTNSGNIKTGSAQTFTFVPLSTIQATSGGFASTSFNQSTALQIW
jgi:hypothetical protein